MSIFRDKSVPWWMRIGVKIVLSRLPIPYSFWKRLKVFDLGDMDQPQRALENFLLHARASNVLDESLPLPQLKPDVNQTVFAIIVLI
jgi:hypothetical protein